MTTAGGVLATLAKSEIEGAGEESFFVKKEGKYLFILTLWPKIKTFRKFRSPYSTFHGTYGDRG